MFIDRINQTRIFTSFEGDFVTVVLGPRRVGKTTLVTEYANKHPQVWAFLNMDRLEERRRIEKNELKALIQETVQKEITQEKIWVVIDEAQKCPELFDQVKILYDKFKGKSVIKFILTGSGFLSLHQLSAETLAGRVEIFYLREFCLQETLLLHEQNRAAESSALLDLCECNDLSLIEEKINARAPLRPLLNECLTEQLLWGGFPEVLQFTTVAERRTYLANYLQTYLEKDIRALAIIDLDTYQKLVEIIAEQTGSMRQDKRIVEALGCARDTLKKYRGLLLATLVYEEIFPFIGSVLKRIIKSPKGYLLNNGLISYLTGINDISILQQSGLIGHRFENWFLKELRVWLDRNDKRSNICYWRTAAGAEVDFVVVKKPEVFPFEVTYSQKVQDKKLINLRQFMQQESRAKVGFYVYLGEFDFDRRANVYFIPAWAI